MFAHKKITGTRVRWQPLPNIVYIAIWMHACIVWLYYASSFDYIVVSGPFFSAQRVVPLLHTK